MSKEGSCESSAFLIVPALFIKICVDSLFLSTFPPRSDSQTVSTLPIPDAVNKLNV